MMMVRLAIHPFVGADRKDSFPPSQRYPEPLGVGRITCMSFVCVPTESIAGRGLTPSFHRSFATHHHRQNSLTRGIEIHSSIWHVQSIAHLIPRLPTDGSVDIICLNISGTGLSVVLVERKLGIQSALAVEEGGRAPPFSVRVWTRCHSFKVQRNCGRYLLRLRCNQDKVRTVGIFDVDLCSDFRK